MPNPNTLSLESIVDIIVNATPAAAPRSTFNQCLILGTSPRLTQAQRMIQVDQNFAAEMAAAPYAFQTTDPEYIAAGLYFGQSPAPSSGYIGLQDLTALQDVVIHTGNAGTNYVKGDIITVVQGSASGGKLLVGSVSSGGVVVTLTKIVGQQGTGYAVTGATPATTTTNSVAGAGLEVDILTVGETALDALTCCRAANFEWYVCVALMARWNGVNLPGAITAGSGYTTANGLATTGGTGTGCTVNITESTGPITTVTIADPGNGYTAADVLHVVQGTNTTGSFVVTSVKQDHADIALWAQSATPPTVYAYSTADVGVLNGTAGSVGLALQALKYSRTVGQYSTLQTGSVNANAALAICAILGYAMGQNTGLVNSAYTLKFKGEVGIDTEPLTLTSIAAIEGANVNLYLSYGNFYDWFEQGVMADGTFFDQVINRDMLVNDLQLNLADLLNGTPKIPQTDPGETQLIHAVNQAAQKAVDRGYLAPGTFSPLNGLPLLTLNPGDPIPAGFIALAAPYRTQATADRAARKAMPIYLVVCEAGAVHSVTVQVDVQV